MSVCKTGEVEPSKSQFLSKFQKRVLGSALVLWCLSAVVATIFGIEIRRDIYSDAVFSWSCVKPMQRSVIFPDALSCKRLLLPTDWYLISGMIVLAAAISFVVLARIWSSKDEA